LIPQENPLLFLCQVIAIISPAQADPFPLFQKTKKLPGWAVLSVSHQVYSYCFYFRLTGLTAHACIWLSPIIARTSNKLIRIVNKKSKGIKSSLELFS